MLTFIVEILKATAWPAATVGIALLFREQLTALLKRIRKGKIGPAEFEFEEAINDLKEEMAEIMQTPPAIGVGTPTVKLVSSDLAQRYSAPGFRWRKRLQILLYASSL